MMDSRYDVSKWMQENLKNGDTIEAQGILPRYLPHIPAGIKMVVTGGSEGPRGVEPISEEISIEALKKRNPDYILLGSLGNRSDPEKWKGERLILYREKLLNGDLGYAVLRRFETPSWVSRPRLTGMRPAFVLFGKAHNK
jgi:hypothetical protein